MSIAALLLLLAQNPPNHAAGISALEEAYRASPNPDILLSIATTYEQWPGHCGEAIDAYLRFFEACDGCVGLAGAADRFDLALEQCVSSAEEEMALRSRFLVPNKRKRRPREADASRTEIASLLRRVREIDRAEAGRLFVTFVEAGQDPPIALLNELREKIWSLLLRQDADAEQVLAMVGRIRLVDHEAYRDLLDELISAQARDDQTSINSLRIEVIDVLRRESTPSLDAPRALAGCRANPAYELGYLTVNTSPWSEVFVNGDRVGTTPLAKLEVVAGCVTVRAVNPVTGAGSITNATIRPNRTTILSMDLSADRAQPPSQTVE